MAYQYELVLRKVTYGTWTLYSDKGVELYTITRCGTAEEAMAHARVWASSWTSVTIRTQDDEN